MGRDDRCRGTGDRKPLRRAGSSPSTTARGPNDRVTVDRAAGRWSARHEQTQIPPSQATSPSRNRQVRWDWPAVSELGFHASPPESAHHSRSRSRSSWSRTGRVRCRSCLTSDFSFGSLEGKLLAGPARAPAPRPRVADGRSRCESLARTARSSSTTCRAGRLLARARGFRLGHNSPADRRLPDASCSSTHPAPHPSRSLSERRGGLCRGALCHLTPSLCGRIVSGRWSGRGRDVGPDAS